MTRRQFISKVKAAFARRYPDYEHEQEDEVANVVNLMLYEKHVTVNSQPGRVARYVNEFMEGPM